ncbi:ankyrin repeat domain-containing protein [Wolbachia endosymbiont (group B) of Longitarsus flavicornis]|uniref:ankyrin repeat domain-containing protein n=1 Tax=Wolbachia endosymbiont (group B) of Longitarsus flavicornis TaxID=3066135 RepID=UPI0033409558
MERDTRCSKINYGSILEAIKEELKKQDQDTYQEWEGKDFDINHLFGVSLTTEGYNAKLALSHIAAYNGHTEIVSALVKAEGIDVNAASKDGMTPLHLAAFNGHLDTVRVLLAKGADPSLKNKNGDTPRQLAKDKNIIQLLKNAETKQITSKAIKTAVICGVIAALTVGVGFGIANVGLSTLVIAGIAAALVVGIVAFGITYAVSRPSDKLNETYSKAAFAQPTRSPFFS